MANHLALPDGWIQQYDPKYNHPFWVDTRANPPRAIWVHPFEDEQFLSEHPSKKEPDLDPPPSYDAAMSGQASGNGEKHVPSTPKRGVFGKLKDKAIGTKEEREEHKRIKATEAARAEERAREARMEQLEAREAYMREYGGYAPYHPSYPGHSGVGPAPALGNTAALLLGGLAGGLVLGDIFGGGF